MRRRLCDLLACPLCHGALELISAETDDWIEKGHLKCGGCGHSYPVERGVPRLVPINELAEVGMEIAALPADTPAPQAAPEKAFLLHMQLDYKAWKGKLALDAGCADGADALRIVELGAETVALERGGEIFALGELSRARPKLHAVQGDISRPPFKDGVFDLLVLRGGLEKTNSRYQTFKTLARAVRHDGRASVSFCFLARDYSEFRSVFGTAAHAQWLFARLRCGWRAGLGLLPDLILKPVSWLLAASGGVALARYAGFSEEETFAGRLEENTEHISSGVDGCIDPAAAVVWFKDAGFTLEKATLTPLLLRARLLARKL